MKSQEIVNYLQNNPKFFEDHADVLADIYVPHPHGGRTIPLAERQIHTYRNKVKMLEDKLTELVRFGEENDVISEKVHQLGLQLMIAYDLPTTLETFYSSMRNDFSIPYTALRIWGQANAEQKNISLPEFENVSQDICNFAANMATPYCGTNTNFEALAWLGNTAEPITSVALVPLSLSNKTIGLLILASPDEKRFNPEMGLLYLKRMGELVSTAILRFIDLE